MVYSVLKNIWFNLRAFKYLYTN